MRRVDLPLLPLSLNLALALALAVTALAACEPGAVNRPAGSAGPQAPGGATEAAISVDHTAVVAFLGDWTEVVKTGPVMAGGKLKLEYDPSRLPSCRATKYGLPAWSILAYWKTPGTDATYVALSQVGATMQATIEVPEDAASIEVWFLNNDYYGCKQWDSNQGTNYTYEVQAPAQATTLSFGADWTEAASGPVVQGGLLQIAYAPERLSACRYEPGGARAWDIYASWRFTPGGETGTASLFAGTSPGAPPQAPQVSVPVGAASVELWFSNSDTTGCVAWDSNYDANYAFPVVAASGAAQVGWAGDFDFIKWGNQPQHLGDVDPAWYFDSWQGMPLASMVEVQVWIPGLTDVAYPSAQAASDAAASKVVAQVVTDGLSGDVDGWGTRALHYERQQGNNFVYTFRLGELRWQTSGVTVPDGLWRWYARFSADGGGSWTDAGKAEGRRYVVAKTQDCSLFPDWAPPECPQGKAVGWVGDWGRYASHACWYEPSLPDPLVLTKSAVGHDCMVVTADVWVPGLTDAGGSASAILAEVQTDISYSGGPLATPVTYPLTFDKKAGNNYRFAWNLGQLVGMADRDDYLFRFRFSADGGKSWTILGDGTGAAAPWRSLLVRNDSLDVEVPQVCDGVQTWSAASATYPGCVEWAPQQNLDANNCELYVDGLGKGQWSHGGATLAWLEAWIKVSSLDGQVLGVGMWVEPGGGGEVWSYGTETQPGTWLTGFTTVKSSDGTSTSVKQMAFFVDVRRSTGAVERLWLSGGGANYTVESTFAKPGWVTGIGSGSIEYADESAALFDQKHACTP